MKEHPKNGGINSPAINTILGLPFVLCLFILGREYTLRYIVFYVFLVLVLEA